MSTTFKEKRVCDQCSGTGIAPPAAEPGSTPAVSTTDMKARLEEIKARVERLRAELENVIAAGVERLWSEEEEAEAKAAHDAEEGVMPSVADLLSAWESDPASVERAEEFWREAIREGVPCDSPWIKVGDPPILIHDPAAVVAWWFGGARVRCLDALLVALSRIPQTCSACGDRFETEEVPALGLSIRKTCPRCSNNGHEPCPTCGGEGSVVDKRRGLTVRRGILAKWEICALCSGTGSLGIVPGICRRCGKPSEVHAIWWTETTSGRLPVLMCVDSSRPAGTAMDGQEYEESPSPLASPWPRTETR